MKRILWLSLLISASSLQISHAGAANQHEREVAEFVRRLYSHALDRFEFGEFSGRYQPVRHCALIKEFVLADLLSPDEVGDCRLRADGIGESFRYPNLESESLGLEDRTASFSHLKTTAIRFTAEGAVAKVTFEDDPGRVVFFLRRTAQGWRIVNLLHYPLWPIRANKGCTQFDRYSYAVEPHSLDEIEDLPLECQESEKWHMKNRGR